MIIDVKTRESQLVTNPAWARVCEQTTLEIRDHTGDHIGRPVHIVVKDGVRSRLQRYWR